MGTNSSACTRPLINIVTYLYLNIMQKQRNNKLLLFYVKPKLLIYYHVKL